VQNDTVFTQVIPSVEFGCDSVITQYDVKVIVATDEPMMSKVVLYPNPTSDYIQLSWTDPSISTLSLAIKDMTGRTIKRMVGIRAQEAVNVAFLPQGMYLLTLYEGDKVLQTGKLTILR